MDQTVHHLSISGMTCGCCSGRLTRALEATPGVIKALISFEDNNGIFLMICVVERSTQGVSSAASDVYKRQV